MASYINGITTYIPEIQPSDVNLQIESQYAGFRKQKNDAARQQLSQLYGSLLNSPLSRQDNIEARDKFFETIEGQIKKISGMDLSLDQNAYQASQVFNQLLDDKYILKDMSWTKNYENQVLASQYLKNGCTDPEQCGGEWWSGGDRLLEYDREAFANATAEESLRFGNTQYIAKQNVTRKAMDLAKKYGVNITAEQSDGMYIVTQKNGELAEPAFQMMFNGMIADDPKVVDYYNAQARVQRLDFIHQHKDEYGSYDAAEQAYINQMMDEMSYITDDNGNLVSRASQEDIVRAHADKAKIESDYSKTVGVALQKRAQEIGDQKLKNTGDKLVSDSYYFDREYDRTNSVITKINSDRNNNRVSGEQIDYLLAWHKLDNDVKGAAKLASYMDSELKIREDKYGLERYKAAMAKQAQQAQQDQQDDYSSFFTTSTVSNNPGEGLVTEVQNGAATEASQTAGEAVSSLQASFIDLANDNLMKEILKPNNGLDNETNQALKQCVGKIKSAVLSSNSVSSSKSFLSVAQIQADREGYEMIRKNADYISALLTNGDNKDNLAAKNLNNKLAGLVQSYEAVLNTKETAQNFASAIAKQVEAYGLKYGKEDDTIYKKIKGLAMKVADGETVSEIDMIRAMYSSGSREIMDHMKNSKFFFNTGEDNVEMDGYEILGILGSSDDSAIFSWSDGEAKKYLESYLGDYGIYKVYDNDLPADFKKEHPFIDTMINPIGGIQLGDMALGNAIQNAQIGAAETVSGIFDALTTPTDWMISLFGGDELVNNKNKWQDTRNKILNKLHTKSKYVDKDGNDVIDENGKISDNIDKTKLSQKHTVFVPHQIRQDMRNYASALINGREEFNQSAGETFDMTATSNPITRLGSGLALAGSGDYESTKHNLNEIINNLNQAFAFTTLSNDGGYGDGTYGNDASKSYRIEVSNLENSANTTKMIEELQWLATDTNPENLIVTTGYYSTVSEGKEAAEDLWDFLREKGISKQELFGEMQRIIESKAGRLRYDKKGNPLQYDEDMSYLFQYNPIGLGSGSYSSLTVDKRLLAAALRGLNVTEKEISENIPNLVIYNKHGRGREGNGYSPLDNIYKLSPYDKLIKLSGNNGYSLPDQPYARDIKVKINPVKNTYDIMFRPIIGYDENGVPQFSTTYEHADDWSTDDGFNLASYYFNKSMMDYLKKLLV